MAIRKIATVLKLMRSQYAIQEKLICETAQTKMKTLESSNESKIYAKHSRFVRLITPVINKRRVQGGHLEKALIIVGGCDSCCTIKEWDVLLFRTLFRVELVHRFSRIS